MTSSKSQLMKTIQKYDFALYDLSLYLDTHTQCREALQLYAKYRASREATAAEYVRRFGPIEARQNESTTQWDWGKGPYPWEKEGN